MRTYYFVIDGHQYGPVQPDQVATLDITATTLTWYEGLDNWAQAATIPEIAAILADKEAMPENETSPQPAASGEEAVARPELPPPPSAPAIERPTGTEPDEECPRPRLGLAIFSAIMFPTGIAAIVKTALIRTRWNEGRYDDARWLAKSAHKYSIMSIIIGSIFIALIIIYYIVIISILINSSRHGYYY